MSVTKRTLPGLLLAGLLTIGHASSASAVQSIWTLPTRTSSSAPAIDYHALKCSKPVAKPFTGALLVDSKYDQRDPSKSTLAKAPSKQSARIHETVTNYSKTLSLFADYYAQARSPEQGAMALACMDQWLEAWAAAGALQSPEATKTGVAVRNWALGGIAASVLRMQALSGNQLRLSSTQKRWLERLSGIVMAEYEPRLSPAFAYFNNHDYWAAWTLASTAMLLDKPNYLDWSNRVFRRAMSQITLSAASDYAYLPTELGRGELAANYTHYALVPLILVADTLRLNGSRVSAEDSRKLDLLANFAARIVLAPNRLPELKQTQVEVPPYKMAWLIPFLGRTPQHALARQLYNAEDGEVDGYRQIGGQIKPFYSNLD